MAEKTFDQLVDELTLASGKQLLDGTPFRTLIFQACERALRWKAEMDGRNETAKIEPK